MIAMTSDIRPSLSVAEPTPLADSNTRLQAYAMLPVKCFASVAHSAQDSQHPASSARVEVGWLPAAYEVEVIELCMVAGLKRAGSSLTMASPRFR